MQRSTHLAAQQAAWHQTTVNPVPTPTGSEEGYYHPPEILPASADRPPAPSALEPSEPPTVLSHKLKGALLQERHALES